MKVLHFITRLIIGGAQENTLLTVEDQFRDYGDDVTLVTGPGLGPEGSLTDRARLCGFRFIELPQLRRNILPWHDWSSWRSVVRCFRDLKPDLVHTHSTKAGILGRAAAAKLNIPAVHTIHGAAFHRGLSWPLYRAAVMAERWAGRRCERLISVCDAMTAQYLAEGIGRPEMYVTVYSGMEVEPFLNPPRPRNDVRKELGFAPGDVVVGKIARLFHLKGHADVLAAAREVIARAPQVRFLFVGDGILRPQFERQIRDWGLERHFVFTGLVPPERIPELVHAMDIVVHTSLREGLARVLPQALIAGKPAISYDIDGAREVVQTGETGVLLEPGNVRGLTEAICSLAGDEPLRNRLGATGRARYTDQFRHQTMTRRLREIYADVLAGQSAPVPETSHGGQGL